MTNKLLGLKSSNMFNKQKFLHLSYVDVKHIAADKNKVRTSKLYNIFLFCLFVLRSFPKV